MLVLAAVAGITSAAQAQFTTYKIWVDGIQVTSQNATTGIGGTGIKSGKVTYDASTSTLLLDNAVIVRGGNACIEIQQADVKVKFRGVCALSCSSSEAKYATVEVEANTTFECEAGSHTTIYRSASHAVWLYNDNTTLTINGPGQLKVDTRNYLDTDGVTIKTTSGGKSGFVGKNGTQVLKLQSNHNVTINSRQACLWDFKDVQCAGNGLLYCMATDNSSEPCFQKVRALTLSGNQSVRLPSGAAFNSSDQSIVAAGVKVYAADVAIAGGSVVKVSFGSPNGNLEGSGKAGQLKLYGDGYYVSGQSVTVTAVNNGTDKDGIEFVGWKTTGGSLQSSNMKYTFNASATTLNAHYKYKQYTVTTSVTPTGSGTITRTGNANYWGASVSLQATANSGWKFVGWREKTLGNTIISTDNPFGLILRKNWDLVAVFDRDYDVVVAGTKVTAQNSNNITSTNMTGTAKYDASTKTLTLTGVTIKNVDYCIQSGEDLKNIVFNGTCSLTSSNCCVRYSSTTTRALNITCQSGSNVKMETTTSGKNECIWYDNQGTYSINGPGKLTLKSTNYGINIRAAGALTFANGHDVTITSVTNGIIGNGANGSVTISGTGKMTITPGSNYTAIKDFPTFTLNNQQEIIYPDGATYSTTNKRVERNSAIYTGEVQIAQRYYTISVSSNNTNYGTVSGGGSILKGSSVTVTATPKTGYKFVHWIEGGSQLSSSVSYTITADKNRTLQAVFEPKSYDISASANPSSAGTVQGAGSYNYNTQASLSAVPKTGYTFVKWTENGYLFSTDNPYSFTVQNARTLVAHFKAVQYNITASASPAAGGTVTGGGTKEHGANVTLTATPNTGYKFVRWTEGGSQVSTNATYTFTADKNRTLVAVFEEEGTPDVAVTGVSLSPTTKAMKVGEKFTLVAQITPSNATNQNVTWISSDATVATVSNGEVTAEGVGTATITVTTVDGNKTATCEVTVSAAAATTYALTIVSPTNGTLTASPSGNVAEGVEVTLTATPASGYKLKALKAYKTGETSTVVAISENKFNMPGYPVTVEAEFEEEASSETYYLLTVVSPTNGTLTASPSGYISEGTEVTLTATPASGYKLKALKAYKTGEASTAVAITGNKFTMPAYEVTVEAEFEKTSSGGGGGGSTTYYTLSYTAGEGGSIKGATTQTVAQGGSGQEVEAVPNSGYVFKKWSDGLTSAKRTDYNVQGNRTFTAEFEKSNTTGIFDTKLDALSVYPNPTQGVLWVSVPELAEGTAAEVHVYNANGQLLQRVPAHGASAGSAASRLSIDLSAYPAGMYIIRVGNAVAKVVKQ